MKPSEFYKIPLGEKRIIACFMKLEIEERQKELRQIYGGD